MSNGLKLMFMLLIGILVGMGFDIWVFSQPYMAAARSEDQLMWRAVACERYVHKVVDKLAEHLP